MLKKAGSLQACPPMTAPMTFLKGCFILPVTSMKLRKTINVRSCIHEEDRNGFTACQLNDRIPQTFLD